MRVTRAPRLAVGGLLAGASSLIAQRSSLRPRRHQHHRRKTFAGIEETQLGVHAKSSAASRVAAVQLGGSLELLGEGNEEVLAFLESRGIPRDVHSSISLPTHVEVLKDRLDFLDALGLDVPSVVTSFPPLLGCSLSRNFIPVLNFLEGIPILKQDLPQFLTTYPQALYASVQRELMPRTDFLEGLGVQRQDIGSVVTKFPPVLGLPLEGSMSTSVAYLVSLGVGLRSIGPIVTEEPLLLSCKVSRDFLPKVTYLKDLGLLVSDIARLIEAHPFVLLLDLERNMKPSIEALRQNGIEDSEALRRIVMTFPQVLKLDAESLLKSCSSWLTRAIGVTESDVPTMVASMPQLLVIQRAKAEEKLDLLRHWGLTGPQMAQVVKRCPSVLGLHLAKSLAPKLSLLLDQYHRSTEEVCGYPEALLLPLNVLKDRHEALRKLKLQQSLFWTCACSDVDFQRRIEVERAAARNNTFSNSRRL